MTKIGRVSAPGRSTNFAGHTESASQGTINQERIATRPVLRQGEILEAIPDANDPAVNPTLGGGGVNDYHFHSTLSRIFRLTYAVPF